MRKHLKPEEIALFRFGIIAPVIHNSTGNQTRYFKDMAKRVHNLPDGSQKKFHWRTFKTWLRIYRLQGFDGLKPIQRKDCGKTRVISPGLADAIKAGLAEYPSLSCATLYRILVNDGSILNSSPAEGTVRAFIKDNNLRPKDGNPAPRKKFEKPFVNDLWLCDFLHGPRLLAGGKKKKIFLTAIIDDHSRFIVGFRWAFQENTHTLEMALKYAFSAHGLPKVLYCDNGAVFVSSHLQLICARLGIALIHSKPYDSPSRGKIERFFRTVRDNFLVLLPQHREHTIEDFNERFRSWLDQEYHRRLHHGILQSPLDRYINNSKNLSLRRVNQNELEECFFHTFHRKVKNDSTISVNGELYEVPPEYIGSNIELRAPADDDIELWIYENDKPVIKIQKVDPVANSSARAGGIKFNSLHEEE
jgi:putative transposase